MPGMPMARWMTGWLFVFGPLLFALACLIYGLYTMFTERCSRCPECGGKERRECPPGSDVYVCDNCGQSYTD